MFVGGQVDKTDQGEPLHPYDLERQTMAVVGHIDTVLHGLGSGLKDVTKLVAFYASDGSIDEQIFLEHVGLCIIEHSKDTLQDRGPAITAVPLPCLALPGMMVEIEAIAMAQESTTDRVTTNPEGRINISKIRVVGIGQLPPLVEPVYTLVEKTVIPFERRSVYSEALEAFIDTPIYLGSDLNHGQVLKGPAIIEEATTTILASPGDIVTVDHLNNYIITYQDEAL